MYSSTKLSIFKCDFQNHFLTQNSQDNNENPILPYRNEGGVHSVGNNLSLDDPRKSVKSQECKICGRLLSSIASYYVHMKSHSGNKPYKCTFCDISFTRKPYLEVHMRTHTGEKPFSCSLCKKSFTQKSSLNTHMRVHSGDKPFACELCEKTFALKSYLVAHRWSHVGKGGNTVSCDLCGEGFSSKAQATAHLRVHNSFPCGLCHRSFFKESFLLRHRIRAHPETNVQPLQSSYPLQNNSNHY